MHMKYISLITTALIFSLAACTSDKKNAATGETTGEDSCRYAFQTEFTTLEWTAYKFTEKAGVKGTFKTFTVSPAKEEAGSVADLMSGMQFTIDPSSVNSGDSTRDPKIVKHFFGALTDSSLSGKITNVVLHDEKGRCEIAITMNGRTSSVLGDIAMEGNTVTLTTNLNMNAWDAQHAVTSLNEVCKDLHTGTDGVSILWPDVAVKVISVVKAIDCDTP